MKRTIDSAYQKWLDLDFETGPLSGYDRMKVDSLHSFEDDKKVAKEGEEEAKYLGSFGRLNQLEKGFGKLRLKGNRRGILVRLLSGETEEKGLPMIMSRAKSIGSQPTTVNSA